MIEVLTERETKQPAHGVKIDIKLLQCFIHLDSSLLSCPRF